MSRDEYGGIEDVADVLRDIRLLLTEQMRCLTCPVCFGTGIRREFIADQQCDCRKQAYRNLDAAMVV